MYGIMFRFTQTLIPATTNIPNSITMVYTEWKMCKRALIFGTVIENE